MRVAHCHSRSEMVKADVANKTTNYDGCSLALAVMANAAVPVAKPAQRWK